MDIQVETTSSSCFQLQASDKALQTHIQSMQRHKQKLIQSKYLFWMKKVTIICFIQRHHPTKMAKLVYQMKEGQGEKKQLDISGCLCDMQG